MGGHSVCVQVTRCVCARVGSGVEGPGLGLWGRGAGEWETPGNKRYKDRGVGMGER